MGSVKPPTPDELNAVGRQLGMTLSDDDVTFFLETMGGSVAAYHAIESMADPMPPREVPAHAGPSARGRREQVQRLVLQERGARARPPASSKGKRIALKDNVCLAGVPMMNGASTLEGYVPDVDATIVTRILDAGGTIAGQGALRVLLLLGRQPHERGRARPQPAQDGLLGRRLVVGQRRRRGRRRGRDGDRRRPGRLHPHSRRPTAASTA